MCSPNMGTIFTCSECEPLSESLWPSPQVFNTKCLSLCMRAAGRSRRRYPCCLQPDLLWPLGETRMLLQMCKADQHHFHSQSPSQEMRNIIFLSDFPEVITAASFRFSLWWQGEELSMSEEKTNVWSTVVFNTFNSSVHTMKGP